jgi:hypothetical protein
LKGAFRVVGILRARLGQSDEADGILAAPQEGKLMKNLFCRWISCQKDPKSEASKMFEDVPRCSTWFVHGVSHDFSKTVLASHLQTSNHSQVLAPAPASVVKPQPSKSMRTTKFVGRILRISPRISGDFMEKPWGNLWEVKLISADKDEFRDLHPRADGSPMFSSSFMATVATVDYWASVCTSHHGIQLSTVPVPKSLHPSFTF